MDRFAIAIAALLRRAPKIAGGGSRWTGVSLIFAHLGLASHLNSLSAGNSMSALNVTHTHSMCAHMAAYTAGLTRQSSQRNVFTLWTNSEYNT